MYGQVRRPQRRIETTRRKLHRLARPGHHSDARGQSRAQLSVGTLIVPVYINSVIIDSDDFSLALLAFVNLTPTFWYFSHLSLSAWFILE